MNNKIATRLILSITIILAGLVLMMNAKADTNTYSLTDSSLLAGNNQMFVAQYKYSHNSKGIPQFEINGVKQQVFCIERGRNAYNKSNTKSYYYKQ